MKLYIIKKSYSLISITTSKTNMLLNFAVVMFVIVFADADLNPLKSTEVAVEEENIYPIEHISELYYNTHQEAVISRKRRYSDELDGKNAESFFGTDYENLRTPREVTDISELDKSETINQYKNFQRQNDTDHFRKNLLVDVLSRLEIENNPDVKEYYKTLEFIDEFKSLEEQYCPSSKFPPNCEAFRNVNEDADFLLSFKSLSDRINEHALEVQNSNDKKILGYLYTATLGKIYNLEDHLEATLIEDIHEYLDSVKYDIQEIKDLQNVKEKIDITNKYKQQYKTVVTEKIKHANDLISKEILLEIDYIKTETDDRIEKLVTEIIELQNIIEKDNDDLIVKQKKIEKAVLSQLFLGPLKILGQALSFIGRAEEFAGSAIEFISTLEETVFLDIPSTKSILSNLKQSKTDLNSLQDQISKFSDQKVNRLKKTLEIVYEEIRKHPEVLASISAKVSDIRSRIDKIVKNKINIREVQDLETELKTIIQIQKNEIIKEGGNDQKLKSAVTVIDNLLTFVQLSSVDIFNNYSESPRKLFEIRKVIQQNENKIGMLKEHEEKMYTILVPLLENIKNDLDDMISKIDKKDKVVFDVTKWKVKNTLKDLMLELQLITGHFNVQGSLKRYTAKIQDAIFNLNITYDYIQDYQKHKTLANFISFFSSVIFNEVYVSYGAFLGGDFRDVLRDLEITIRTNIVTHRYKVAIDVFKQFVFPLAHLYFKRLPYSSYHKLDNKLDNIIVRAMNDFERLKSLLEFEEMYLSVMDNCIGTGPFNDEPFFTWDKKTNKYMFSKLLSGKEVIVKADIMNYPHLMDAIKFGYAEFSFVTEKGEPQLKLNKILKGFLIHATYFGDSYYRYNGKIYLMTAAAYFSFFHSFVKRHDGKPEESSFSFHRFGHKGFILSPYATWKLKLTIPEEGESSFKDLVTFMRQNALKLVLGGSAQYVTQRQDCADLMVDEHYKALI